MGEEPSTGVDGKDGEQGSLQARQAIVNQEIKRHLTSILLDVTDAIFGAPRGSVKILVSTLPTWVCDALMLCCKQRHLTSILLDVTDAIFGAPHCSVKILVSTLPTWVCDFLVLCC